MDYLLTDRIRARWQEIVIINETPQEVLAYAKDMIFQLCDALDACRRERDEAIIMSKRNQQVTDYISFILPWPPSVNHCWKPRRGGGMYLSEDGRRFKDAAQEIAWAAAQWVYWQAPDKPK